MPKRIKNVLLIYPPTTVEKERYVKMATPPLGIGYIASVLKNDYNVGILDATIEGYENEITIEENPKFFRYGLDYDEIKKRVKEFSPDFVGISCVLSLQYPVVRQICKDIKEIDKDIYVAIGGPHPSFLAQEIMQMDKDLDFIVIGEGEYTMRDLLSTINKERDLSEIDGLAFRKGDRIIMNPKSKFIENLDEIPFPSRELFLMEKYSSIYSFWALPRKNATTLITSRGCPIKCIFCPSSIYWGPNYRMRSVENVLSEMEHLIERYKIRKFHFVEDNLTLDKERTKNLLREIINRKLNISWLAPNGVAVWTLDEELVYLMKESGCYELTLAIESGNQDVLTGIIKKPLNLEYAKKIIRVIKKNKINTCGFFIFGFPGETMQNIKDTVSFAKKLGLDRYIFFSATPFPGTELYKICKEKGYISGNYDVTYNELVSPKFDTPHFTRRDLDKILSRCYTYGILKYLLRHPLKFWPVWGGMIRYKLTHF